MTPTKLHNVNRRAGVRTGAVIIGGLCAVSILTASVTAASASAPATLHFYDKQLSSTFTDPSGHAIGSSDTSPPSGSALNATSIGYVGTFKHHATAPTASIHLACIVTTAPKALCFGQIAIGGSMLLANNFTVSLTGPTTHLRIKLNGGIGKFAHASGTFHATPVNESSSNVTITYVA